MQVPQRLLISATVGEVLIEAVVLFVAELALRLDPDRPLLVELLGVGGRLALLHLRLQVDRVSHERRVLADDGTQAAGVATTRIEFVEAKGDRSLLTVYSAVQYTTRLPFSDSWSETTSF